MIVSLCNKLQLTPKLKQKRVYVCLNHLLHEYPPATGTQLQILKTKYVKKSATYHDVPRLKK